MANGDPDSAGNKPDLSGMRTMGQDGPEPVAARPQATPDGFAGLRTHDSGAAAARA